MRRSQELSEDKISAPENLYQKVLETMRRAKAGRTIRTRGRGRGDGLRLAERAYGAYLFSLPI